MEMVKIRTNSRFSIIKEAQQSSMTRKNDKKRKKMRFEKSLIFFLYMNGHESYRQALVREDGCRVKIKDYQTNNLIDNM